MRNQRLVPIDGLQHEKVGELGGAAPAGRRDTPRERLAALMEQAEKLSGKGGQPIRGAHMQDGWNEILVEDDLLVRPAFNYARERHTGVGVGDVAGQQ